MTFHYSTAEKRLLMIGSADSPSQTNRMIQLAPTSFIALARLSAITLSQQAQSAGKSHRLASQKDSQSIRLASFCLRVSQLTARDRKSTRLNSSHGYISYAVFCLKKKTTTYRTLLRCT